eukprot:SAG31_NODE_2442_length_5683_cov_8.114792_2_plen_42_part_00
MAAPVCATAQATAAGEDPDPRRGTTMPGIGDVATDTAEGIL